MATTLPGLIAPSCQAAQIECQAIGGQIADCGQTAPGGVGVFYDCVIPDGGPGPNPNPWNPYPGPQPTPHDEGYGVATVVAVGVGGAVLGAIAAALLLR